MLERMVLGKLCSVLIFLLHNVFLVLFMNLILYITDSLHTEPATTLLLYNSQCLIQRK